MGRPPIILAGPFIDLEFAARREWLETNGLGGFASSTVIGLNTRRYHSLLTAATGSLDTRQVLLSKLEEAVILNGRRYELSVNRYPGTTHPEGYRWLTEIRLDPLPTFTYELDGAEIRRRIFMVHGENTTVIEYESNVACTLELRPLVAFRDHHALRRRDLLFDGSWRDDGAAVSIQSLRLAHNASSIEATADWYRNIEYDVERERGHDFQEDLFNPFVARFGLNPRHSAVVIASARPGPEHSAEDAKHLRASELARREAIVAASPSDDPLMQQLVAAADQFLLDGGRVAAGYHWYGERSRETMIALPGLTLVTGRFAAARRILRGFSDTGEAALWFVEAARAYLEYSGDAQFLLEELYPALIAAVDGATGDATRVELQALTYNALCVVSGLAERQDDVSRANALRDRAEHLRIEFNRRFWNPETGCLFAEVDGAARDASIRPHQIFAISLPHAVLDREKWPGVVEAVRRELLTRAGLRTLSPHDPGYSGPDENNGSVRPWLLGPFIAGFVKTHGAEARPEAERWLRGFTNQLLEGGLGQISELAGGDAPHASHGAVAQAVNVAELLRAAAEHVFELPRVRAVAVAQ